MNRKALSWLLDFPAQSRRMFHRTRSSAIRRKRCQTEWKPKLPRAIPANCNFESRVRAAPRGAWCQLDGKSHFLSPKHRLARNSEPRKTAHTPAPLQGPQSPADSTSAAPISRFEFASPLASCDYATPAVGLRQPHRATAHRKDNASIAVSSSTFSRPLWTQCSPSRFTRSPSTVHPWCIVPAP